MQSVLLRSHDDDLLLVVDDAGVLDLTTVDRQSMSIQSLCIMWDAMELSLSPIHDQRNLIRLQAMHLTASVSCVNSNEST